MDRKKAIVKFNRESEEGLLKEYKELLNEEIRKNKEKIHQIVMEKLENICGMVTELQVENKEKRIRYFQFSILRTGIVNRKPTMILSAYGKDWYLDEEPQQIEVDISFLYEKFNVLRDELYEKSKEYIGLINKFEIERIIIENAMLHNENIGHCVRSIIRNIDEKPWFDEVRKTDDYYILWGEYQDKVQLIYAVKKGLKTSQDLNEAIKKSEADGRNNFFVYSAWNNSTAADIRFKDKNMMFANFKESDFSNLEFDKGTFIGANFMKSKFCKCAFKGSLLNMASFEKADLKDMEFIGCNLNGADFRMSSIKNVSFEMCDLNGAIFESEVIPFLNLSASQLQTIVIKES